VHRNNFFANETGALSVFDFDDACQHWFSFDLAVVAHQLPRELPTPERRAIWAYILAGYRQVSPLPADFQEELALMLRLRALQLLQFMHKKRRLGAGAGDNEASFRARAAEVARKIRGDEPFDLQP
jgi:amicoumacin kinase